MFRLVTIVMDSYMLVNVMVTLLSINSSGKYSLCNFVCASDVFGYVQPSNPKFESDETENLLVHVTRH